MIAISVSDLALYVPLFVATLLVFLEASQAFEISRKLNRAANVAARALAQEYRKGADVTTSSAKQQAIYTNTRIPNVVASNEQFEIPSGGWNLNSVPSTVTVVVTYMPGKGSPPLPAFPGIDPLNLGQNFKIKSSATYRLQ